MLINVEEVQKILRIPKSTAYEVIRKLNKELADKGFYTIRGKTVDHYLFERYALTKENEQ